MARATRILLVSGSLRATSTNTAVLRTAKAIAPPGITAVLYEGLGDLPHFDPDLDRMPLPRPVEHLRAGIRGADALLLCTPEYAGALPGSFKNLLDWTIGDGEGGSIYEKPVAWINISSGPTAAADAHASLAKVLSYAHAVVVTPACAEIPVTRGAVGDDGLVHDPAVRQNLAYALSTLAAAVPGGERASRAERDRRPP